MKNKRIAALALSACLAAGALMGCGAEGKQDTANTSSSSGQSANLDSSESSKQISGEEGLTYNGQDVSEPVKLVMYYLGDAPTAQDEVLKKINEKLSSKINATIELKNISLSDYQTKYSLTIAGGENVDLIYTSTWAFYQTEASKGAFAEVTEDIIDKDMPLHKEFQDPVSWGQAKINGKIYFVPCNMAKVNGNTVTIRGDLRKKYGIDKIQTSDDFEKYMESVSTDESSGIQFAYNASQNNDLMKRVMYWEHYNLIPIEGAAINYYVLPYKDNVSENDLEWIYATDQYKEYANKMKTWADKGFWSKSAISNSTEVKDSFLSGNSAVFVQNLGTCGVTADTMTASNPGWEPEIFDINQNAARLYGTYLGDGYAVLAGSKNQDRAFMALDLLKFDESLYDLARFGVEGEHYNRVDDTHYSVGPKAEEYPFGNPFSWGLKNTKYDLTNINMNADQVEIGSVWTDKAVMGPIAAFSFDDTNVKNEMANLQALYTQYIPLLDLGLVDDVDKTLNEFDSQAEAAGRDAVEKELKTQLAEYFAQTK